VGQQPLGLVERKGLGDPDSLCDAMMEAISVALCRTYLDTIGQVLHHNIKVMGCQQGRHLTLTIALAFADHLIPNARTYVDRKAAIVEELTRFQEADLRELGRVDVCLNRLDHPEGGLGGMYLTVLGTSAGRPRVDHDRTGHFGSWHQQDRRRSRDSHDHVRRPATLPSFITQLTQGAFSVSCAHEAVRKTV
jgi:S-adenosylmethionine synthetase